MAILNNQRVYQIQIYGTIMYWNERHSGPMNGPQFWGVVGIATLKQYASYKTMAKYTSQTQITLLRVIPAMTFIHFATGK